MDRIWASFCGDFRAGAVGWAGVGGAVWLFARGALDFDWCDTRRGGAGFCGLVLFAAPQWEIAWANGEGGTKHNGWLYRVGRNSGYCHHSACGAGVGSGEGAGGKPVGNLYSWRDDSNSDVHGVLFAVR